MCVGGGGGRGKDVGYMQELESFVVALTQSKDRPRTAPKWP